MNTEQKTISQADRNYLLAAIAKAEQPGACRYMTRCGKPSCVVGQYAFLKGVSIETLKDADDDAKGAEILAEENPCQITAPMGLLADLQQVWDCAGRPGLAEYGCTARTADEARARMLEILNEYTVTS